MAITTPKRKQVADKEEKPIPLDTKLVEEEVLIRLGRPQDLHSISVHRYDSSRCRVNVRRDLNKVAAEAYREQKFSKSDIAKFLNQIDCTLTGTVTIITDSFYLRTNYDGSLRSDCEPIERKY
jgi:hypothetical protein